MKLEAHERALLIYLPATVLLVAFVAVCVQAGTPWPWNRIVHEDGQHTLLGTIFYFEHATRELLLDAALALATAGAVRYFYPPSQPRGGQRIARMRIVTGVAVAVSIALILGGTAYVNAFGPYYGAEARGQAILDNLAQYPTRPGAPFVWGAHWRYHLIERFTEILLVFAAAGFLWLRAGRPVPASGRHSAGLYIRALIAFLGATLVFGVSAEPFGDPRFLGHQLRELVTHVFVTLPLALATCVALGRRFAVSSAGARSPLPTWPIYAAAAIAVVCGGYVLIASAMLKAQTYGQTTSLAALLFPHFFEHSLGYAFTSALAGFLYLLPGQKD